MIALTELSKSYGQQTLFENVTLQLDGGCRYGLVGANGSGKTTLFRLISGEEEASEGSISMAKRLTLGLLSQDHFRFEDTKILDVVMTGHEELWKAIVEKEELLARSEEHFDGERFGELEDIIASNDGYSFEARCGEILEGLGIPTENHHKPLSTLSGGFKLRVLLAQALASNPNCLLLDEPTNHLDILSIRWLEKFLSEHRGCVVVISHDHRFLDNVCTHILDVDYERITLYTGAYTAFVAAKQAERDRREAEIAKQEKKIAEHKSFVDRFKAKATKARQAQSKMKQMDRIVIERLPRTSRRYPKFVFKQKRPSGKDVITFDEVCKSFGDNHVLNDVSLTVRRGDRIAIIGPNGIGKSTLLKIAVGDLQADKGAAEWGHETHPGFFPQDPKEALGEMRGTVESWLMPFCPDPTIGFVRGQLARVLFSGDDVEKKLPSLSGGECARLIFARLTVTQPNVLLLDEPTNHLDLESIEALVEVLKTYDGTLIFVSHDRWFVSKLATRVVEIREDGINDFPGSYDDYLASCGDDHLDSDRVDLKVKREKSKGKNTRRERSSAKRDFRHKQLAERRDTVTKAIDDAEARIADIDALFCEDGFFVKTTEQQVKNLQTEQQTLKDRIHELMAEWEDIEAKLEEPS